MTLFWLASSGVVLISLASGNSSIRSSGTEKLKTKIQTGQKWLYKYSSDWPNDRFGRTVWPNFYCSVLPKCQNIFLQNTELFSLLYIAFFKMGTLYILRLGNVETLLSLVSSQNSQKKVKIGNTYKKKPATKHVYIWYLVYLVW